jgi:mono/diheme cytochrome c family protein
MRTSTIGMLAGSALAACVGLAGVAPAASAAEGAGGRAARLMLAQAETAQPEAAQPETGGVGAPATSNATAALWSKHCASCHGETGKGDTKSGKMLKVNDLTDATVRSGFDRDRMMKATKEGVKKEGSDKLVMKGFADKLTDAEIAALIEHIYAFVK